MRIVFQAEFLQMAFLYTQRPKFNPVALTGLPLNRGYQTYIKTRAYRARSLHGITLRPLRSGTTNKHAPPEMTKLGTS